ncbi:hypothetical protein MKW98_000871, partial [Papaver atlanticum]
GLSIQRWMSFLGVSALINNNTKPESSSIANENEISWLGNSSKRLLVPTKL